MRDVFISHADEEGQVALAIARGLRAAGYSTWSYEEDSDPGISYLSQIDEELEATQAVVLVISPSSLGSTQVLKEIVRAHEGGKPFIPIRCGVSHDAVQQQREWRMALGAAVSIAVPPEGVETILPRILRGLERSGIRPSSDPVEAGVPVDPPPRRGVADRAVAPQPRDVLPIVDRLAHKLRGVSDSARLTLTSVLGVLGLIGTATNYVRAVDPDPMAALLYRLVPAIGTANKAVNFIGFFLNAAMLWSAWKLYSGETRAAARLRGITAIMVQVIAIWFVAVVLATIFASHLRPPADRLSIIMGTLVAALVGGVPSLFLHALYRR